MKFKWVYESLTPLLQEQCFTIKLKDVQTAGSPYGKLCFEPTGNRNGSDVSDQ